MSCCSVRVIHDFPCICRHSFGPSLRSSRPSRSPSKHLQLRASFEDPRLQSTTPYTPGPLDALLLNLFRKKMAQMLGPLERVISYERVKIFQEVGWNSSKPGYDGLIEVAQLLFTKNKDRTETEAASVRILRSLFPPFLLPLFRALIAPLFGGKPAAILTARVTQATCQWLMGRCTVNTVVLEDGSSLDSGVLVERCKYLEESKCAGICIHTCKLPSQSFITDYMGIPLTMEPNFEDFSCQFKFGVKAPSRKDDENLKTKCLDICPYASSRSKPTSGRCPQVLG